MWSEEKSINIECTSAPTKRISKEKNTCKGAVIGK